MTYQERRAEVKAWLDNFCRQVVPKARIEEASALIRGGADGFYARHGSPEDVRDEHHDLEIAVWFLHDNKLLDKDMTPEDKRVAILLHLEKVKGKA